MKAGLLSLAVLLMGSWAAGAQDLPVSKSAPDQNLQACVAVGVGFWAIPGTDTCLKIGGEVRADYVLTDQNTRNEDTTGFFSRAQIGFDARTNTDYGLLRSYFLIDGYIGPGQATSFIVDKAFLQFGGLTAGYAHSFFGIYDLDYGNDLLQPYFGYAATTDLLAYTQELGGGLSATLSIEDGRGTHSTLLDTFGFPTNIVQSGGTVVPDIVGQLRYDANWGEAAAFGALHQIRYPGPPDIGGSDYGYAFGGALGVDLPVLSGGHIAVEGTYAKGASAYLGWQQLDAAFDNFNVRTDLGRGWTATGEIGLNLTSRLTFNLLGSYIDYTAATTRTSFFDPIAPDIRGWIAGGNAVYAVTRGLSLGAETYYASYRAKGGTNFSAYEEETEGWTGVLRVRRTF
jgi:Porin subfamily